MQAKAVRPRLKPKKKKKKKGRGRGESDNSIRHSPNFQGIGILSENNEQELESKDRKETPQQRFSSFIPLKKSKKEQEKAAIDIAPDLRSLSDRLLLLLLSSLTLLLRGLVCLRSRPLGGLGPLGLLPRTHVTQFTASLALAGAAEFLGEILLGDLCQEVLLVARAQNVDLVNGDGVQEALDDIEDAAKAPGGVDEVQLAQSLRVVVLRDARSLLQVSVHGGDAGDPDALQVHDGAAGLHQTVGLSRAGGQTRVRQLLVFTHQVLQHAFASGDLVHGVEIDLAQFLDVDGSAILSIQIVNRSTSPREDGAQKQRTLSVL